MIYVDSKVCTKCGIEKSLDCFSKLKKSKDGRSSICRQCDAEYYQANKEKIKDRAKKNYEDNKQDKLDYQRKYREENLDKVKERSKRYREANKESIADKKHRYYEENKEAIAERAKKARQRDKEKLKERRRIHYQQNKDIYRERAKKYRENNKEKLKEYKERWRKEHFDVVLADCAFRRAKKRNATPKWLSDDQKKQLRLKFTEKQSLEKQTGLEFHVDHIIPLTAKITMYDPDVEDYVVVECCGLHVPWNLRVELAEDNLTKGSNFPEEIDYRCVQW